MYLLGERYIEAVRNLGASPNAKTVVYPADLANAFKGLFTRA